MIILKVLLNVTNIFFHKERISINIDFNSTQRILKRLISTTNL